MAKPLAFFSAVFAALLLAASSAFAGPDCKCVSNGEFFVQGEHTCIKTNQGYRLARCDMVLNNTSWVMTGESCPLTAVPPGEDLKGRLLALAAKQAARDLRSF